MDSLLLSNRTRTFQAPVAVADNTRVVRPHLDPAPQSAPQTRFANLNLHNAWSDISRPAPMPADATRVAPRPPVEHKPQQPVRTTARPPQRPTMPADATRVAPRPRVEEKKPEFPQQPQLYFRQGSASDFARSSAQENLNTMCELDPFAAQVNGMHDVSLNGHPNWQKVSGSPLEYVTVAKFPTTFGLVGSYRSVSEAVHEPTALNIGMAALSTGSLLVGNLTRFEGLPHGVEHVAEGAERVHQGLNLLETGGSLDRIKESLHHEGAERPE